uniref:sperm-associated antigen 8 n=1 Tax=Pristiophorus japonicus TaxID=55135 RepID=UPI00398ED11F
MEQVVCDEASAARLPPPGSRSKGEEAGTGAGARGPGPDAGRKRELDEDGCPKLSERQGAGGQQDTGDGDGQPAAQAAGDTAQRSNEDRIKNKCLIGNWLEQRNSAAFDESEEKATTHALAFKNGRKGLLTTDYLSRISDITTYRELYPPPKGPPERERGIKMQLVEKYLHHKICKEVFDEHNVAFAMAPIESLSVTGRDFRIEGFKSVPPPPTMEHNYKIEQPITIWSDHAKRVHGVTAITTGDTPFRKNTSFTKPIMETLDG